MILVTGATGKLGHHVIEGLLKKVPAQQIIAAVRDPKKAASFAERGVQVRRLDYDVPQTLAPALQGVTHALLISSNDLENRTAQHRAFVEAARKAGVRLIAYTSIVNADKSSLTLAQDHLASEKLIRDSGVPYVFLRNGWYFENFTESLAPALAHGAMMGGSGEGRFGAASRADYAAAAVAVLTGTGHDNRVYELAGDTAFSRQELAAEVSRQSGKSVAYQDLPPAKYQAALEGVGLPRGFAALLVNSDEGAARGELNNTSGDLHRLIGRATTPLADAVAAALRH